MDLNNMIWRELLDWDKVIISDTFNISYFHLFTDSFIFELTCKLEWDSI